jgi:hypothetical protein
MLKPVRSTMGRDTFTGQIITCTVVITFLAVFLLREWIGQQGDIVALPPAPLPAAFAAPPAPAHVDDTPDAPVEPDAAAVRQPARPPLRIDLGGAPHRDRAVRPLPRRVASVSDPASPTSDDPNARIRSLEFDFHANAEASTSSSQADPEPSFEELREAWDDFSWAEQYLTAAAPFWTDPTLAPRFEKWRGKKDASRRRYQKLKRSSSMYPTRDRISKLQSRKQELVTRTRYDLNENGWGDLLDVLQTEAHKRTPEQERFLQDKLLEVANRRARAMGKQREVYADDSACSDSGDEAPQTTRRRVSRRRIPPSLDEVQLDRVPAGSSSTSSTSEPSPAHDRPPDTASAPVSPVDDAVFVVRSPEEEEPPTEGEDAPPVEEEDDGGRDDAWIDEPEDLGGPGIADAGLDDLEGVLDAIGMRGKCVAPSPCVEDLTGHYTAYSSCCRRSLAWFCSCRCFWRPPSGLLLLSVGHSLKCVFFRFRVRILTAHQTRALYHACVGPVKLVRMFSDRTSMPSSAIDAYVRSSLGRLLLEPCTSYHASFGAFDYCARHRRGP